MEGGKESNVIFMEGKKRIIFMIRFSMINVFYKGQLQALQQKVLVEKLL